MQQTGPLGRKPRHNFHHWCSKMGFSDGSVRQDQEDSGQRGKSSPSPESGPGRWGQPFARDLTRCRHGGTRVLLAQGHSEGLWEALWPLHSTLDCVQ